MLAQRAADARRGELCVIPDLLDGLDLRGCLVSLDALACQPAIAERITAPRGGYLPDPQGQPEEGPRRGGGPVSGQRLRPRRVPPPLPRRVRRRPRPAGAPARLRL